MSTTTQNQAAWLDGIGQPLRVGPANMPAAGEGEIVIRNRAVAVNPVSWKIQDRGLFVQQWPVVLDYDVAGEVHQVGKSVTKFQRGDRVVAWIQGPTNPDTTKYGAFQLYCTANATTVATLPDDIAFERGCVLPVAFNTAIVGLCGPPGLGFSLQTPSLSESPTGKIIVVWAASSSVGLLTLQIARAVGIETIAVASPRNHALCMACGASDVFDYHEEATVVGKVVDAIKSSQAEFVGIFDCISEPDSLRFTIPILSALDRGQLNFVLPNVDLEVPANIKLNHVLGRDQDVVLSAWRGFLTPALQQGKLQCLPDPLVVGAGLEYLQEALDTQRNGVSAKKVVVTF